MKLRNLSTNWYRTGSGLVFWTSLICLVLIACQAQQTATIAETGTSESSLIPIPDSSLTPTLAAFETLPTQPTSTIPALTPSPILIGPQIVLNSSFDDGVKGWEQPYGDLQHTTADFHTRSGAARLVTNSATGFLDYRASAGQCIDMTSYMAEWPKFGSQLYMTLEVYLKTDEEITNVTLNGIFLDDTECGTGQVGYFDIPALGGSEPWTRVVGIREIPVETRSFHVFINASGKTDSATILIDDLRAYAAEPPQN